MDILIYKKTMTSQFIMPLLFINKNINEIIPEFNSFVGAYIADFDKPQNDNKIVLVFNKKQKQLPENKQVDHYTKTIKDETYYCYVYDIPDSLSENYTHFLVGKYSLFSDQAKKQITNFWNAGSDTLLYGVLNGGNEALKKFFKDNFKKDVDSFWRDEDKELWFAPTLQKEIYGAE